jgi:hypothetical protein
MPINAGDVIYITAHFTIPPKPKYLICVCPKTFRYMVINSGPYLLASMAQLRITVGEVTCLQHDSYVDTSKLVTLTKMETTNVVEAKPSRNKGPLPIAVRKRIKEMVSKHGIMPNDQVALLMANL